MGKGSGVTHPFDTLADRYDAEFTHRPLGRLLRERVRGRLAAAFTAGHHVLELGCGTGEDAIWLAERAVRVTAVDASAAMLRVAEGKVRRSGTADRITLCQVDLATGTLPSAGDRSELFDGAFSNFGVLNCVSELGPLASAVATRLRLGARLLVVVMGPYCPWEVIGFGVRGRFRDAFRRTVRRPRARFGETASMPVWYYAPSAVRAAMAPWFRHVDTAGVGVLLPPTDFSGVVERWPRVFRSVAALDRSVSATAAGAWFNDHHLSVFERC